MGDWLGQEGDDDDGGGSLTSPSLLSSSLCLGDQEEDELVDEVEQRIEIEVQVISISVSHIMEDSFRGSSNVTITYGPVNVKVNELG